MKFQFPIRDRFKGKGKKEGGGEILAAIIFIGQRLSLSVSVNRFETRKHAVRQ